MPEVEIEVVDIEKEEEDQVVVGMANFTIKTCDDLFRAVVSAVPGVEVGVAMNEAVPKLTRFTGNEEKVLIVLSVSIFPRLPFANMGFIGVTLKRND